MLRGNLTVESGSSEQFELIFEGLQDDSEDTLRKVKGVFLTELDLSATRALEILQNVPSTIATSSVEDELAQQYTALKKAGCKVMLVRPEIPQDDNEDELSMAVDYDFSGALESIDRAKEECHKQAQETEDEDETEDSEEEIIEFSIDLDELAAEPAVSEPKSSNVPTYSLDLDDDLSELLDSIDNDPVKEDTSTAEQVEETGEISVISEAGDKIAGDQTGAGWDLSIELDSTTSAAPTSDAFGIDEVVQQTEEEEVCAAGDDFDLTINLETPSQANNSRPSIEESSDTEKQIAELADDLAAFPVGGDQSIPTGILKMDDDEPTHDKEPAQDVRGGITSDDLAAELIPNAPLFGFDDSAIEPAPEIEKAEAEAIPEVSFSFEDAESTVDSGMTASDQIATGSETAAPEPVEFLLDEESPINATPSDTTDHSPSPQPAQTGLSLDVATEEIEIVPDSTVPEPVQMDGTLSLSGEDEEPQQQDSTVTETTVDAAAQETQEPPAALPPLGTISRKKVKIKPKKIEETQETAPVEVTVAAEEQEIIETAPPAGKPGRKLPIDMICATVVGVALLVFFNFVRKPETPTLGASISPQAIQASLQRQKNAAMERLELQTKSEKARKEDPTEVLPAVKHPGEYSDELYTVRWELTAKGNRPVFLVLEGTTPEPPELTPEQVVREEEKDPWVQKFETDRIRFIPQDDGSFSGTGISKFYVVHPAGRDRVVGRIQATATRKSDEIMVAFTMWAGKKNPPEIEQSFMVAAADTPGTPYTTYLKGAFEQSTLVSVEDNNADAEVTETSADTATEEADVAADTAEEK